MAKAFALTRLGQMPAILAPHNTRFLPSAIAHYLHPDPTVAFTLIDAVAILGIVLAFYGILRFYGLPVEWALIAIIWYLVIWPGLRFWIYYPVLTDQLGTALALGALWAILTKRYLVYTLTAAALMFTRENGFVVVVFFALFHLNPWNPNRERSGHPLVRLVRLVAWNILPFLALRQARLHPVFPQSNEYNMLTVAIFARDHTLESPEKLRQWLVAALNVCGLAPYALLLGVFRLGLSRIAAALGANLHWVAYASVAVLLAPLSWTDHERFLILAMPPLILAGAQCWRSLPAGPLTWIVLGGVTLLHAWMVNAFTRIVPGTLDRQMWASVMSQSSAQPIVNLHLTLAAITAACLPIVAIRSRRRRADNQGFTSRGVNE